MMYVRATREEEDKVSKVLSSNAVAGGIQPGLGRVEIERKNIYSQ